MKTMQLYMISKHDDWLWDSRWVTIWIVAEVNTGIVAGSIPATRACFRALMGNHATSGHDQQKRVTPLSLTTIGSNRRSWRMMANAQRLSLAAAGIPISELPRALVGQEDDIYELLPVESRDLVRGTGSTEDSGQVGGFQRDPERPRRGC